MQLAREALALELLGRHDPAQGIALHALRELDRYGRTRGEDLGEAHVVVGEAGVRRRELVVGRDHADRAVLDEQRHPEAGAGVDAAGEDAVDLGVVEHRVDPVAAAALQHAPRLGLVQRQQLALHLVRLLAGRRDDPDVLRACRQRDRHEPSLQQVVEPLRDQVEQPVDRRLARHRAADLHQRLELPRPAGGRLVQARVLDRDGRLRRRAARPAPGPPAVKSPPPSFSVR